jgi:leader peptidase (prepilin peptidase)/N-methyltransferase
VRAGNDVSAGQAERTVGAGPDLPGGQAESTKDAPLFGTPEQWLAYPHARREVLIELLFLGWPILGAILGNALMPVWNFNPTQGQVPLVLALFVLMGVAGGYLVGGAIVWLTRLLGTLAFGKEAMGLGDVHLMAAIGAVLGWRGALVAFFLAPFGGIIGAGVLVALRRVGGKPVRVVPYGPYMAVAAVLTMAFGDRILALLGLIRP